MVLAILDKGKPVVTRGRKARSRESGRPVAEQVVERWSATKSRFLGKESSLVVVARGAQ